MSTVFCDIFQKSGNAISGVIQKLKLLETCFIFCSGAFGYWAVELLWRGYTHWTMPILGGVCLILIYAIANFMAESLWKKWLMCSACVTAVEFIVGGIVNITLNWDVWDYSTLPGNLMGQICPLYSIYWILLSIPSVFFCNILRYYVFIPLYRKGRHSP